MCFGWCSLETDKSDISACLTFLLSHHGYERFILLGHSTGCQQSIHYLSSPGSGPAVSRIVMQAPVSDRESSPPSPSLLSICEEMRGGGRGEEFMPREAHWAPITAERFWSLYVAQGEGDDYFSGDLAEGVVKERVQPGEAGRVVAVCSRQDEYVPEHVDKESLASMWRGLGWRVEIIDGNHNLGTGAEEFLGILGGVLNEVLEAE